MIANLAFGVSLLSLALAGVACWRAWRGERLQRGRIEVITARIANLFEGGQTVLNLTLRNSGRDAVTISTLGIEYWIEDLAGGLPETIAMMPRSFQLAVGQEELFQDRIELEPGQMRAIIDQRDALSVGIRAEFIDAIGPQVRTWAFHHVAGSVDMFDKLEPTLPMPAFLQRPVYR